MKWTIGKRIIVLGIIPSLAVIFFLYAILAEKISVKSKANNVSELSQYVINASRLVHNIQKERGASAVHIGSGGKEMKTELENIKRETDNALASLQDFMASFDAKRYGSGFSSNVNSALNQLGELSSRRSAVVSLSVSKGDATRYYTTINSSFIQSFENVTLQANHPQITAPTSAYVNLLSAKELAGIERAVMSGIMATNKPVDSNGLSNWMTFWKGQERLMNNFEYLASKGVLSFYKSNHSGEDVERVSEIRSLILEKANEGNFGITGKETFAATTRRIEILKQVEDFQSNELQNLAAAISSEANNSVILYSSIGGGVLAVVFFFIFYFTSKITTLLRNVVVNLTNISSLLGSAAAQVSGSSQSLAEGSSEQASSIEETSATMEEMAATTKQNADNSKEAASVVNTCSTSAISGNKAVEEMNNSMDVMNASSREITDEMSKSMGEINESSKKIAEITKVIDGIAFQTNLLALNAAVEAARAGEHGKGFAVVAEEVRNLAQRSAAAAKDTTVLIEDCVGKAEKGAGLAEKCKQDLQGIVDDVKKAVDTTKSNLLDIDENVKKASTLTNEISSASTEQSEGIDQVNHAIQQLDQLTQSNAARAEETASVSEELSSQANSLEEQVKILSAQVGGGADKELNIHQKSVVQVRQEPLQRIQSARNEQATVSVKGNGGIKEQPNNPDELIPMIEETDSQSTERFKDF
jgi:methyl-accepting chemotaxis protein